MIETEQALYGRQLPDDELPVYLRTAENVSHRPALVQRGGHWWCQRCGQKVPAVNQLPDQNWFCSSCMILGRLTSRDQLYTIPEPNAFPHQTGSRMSWQGQLSAHQLTGAEAILTHLKAGTPHLLWAVTGAGKTEMLFPSLDWALSQGWRIGIVSPRVDVVLELAPRLQRAFAGVPLCLLYGGQTVPYHYSQLVVATVHQLWRFYQAFDLLIVDEVDAFPYAQSPALKTAVLTALKTSGVPVYLTATPGTDLLQAIRSQRLAVTYLPLRYHQHLLPELRVSFCWRWRRRLTHGRLPGLVQRRITHYLLTEQPFLIFVPRVADLSLVAKALGTRVMRKGATVHAADVNRQANVQRLRDHAIQFLVTTTILERGVTFPNIAVIILGADDATFSTAALVQIAGRVGRSAAHPRGEALAVCQSMTQQVWQAQQMIRQLNRRGAALGGQP